jgi:hypothetical protein
VGQGGAFPEVMNLTLRRDTIVTVLALLVLAIALPFAIVDTFETGRVYLFSKQFIEELPQRFTGPGRLRFILQRVKPGDSWRPPRRQNRKSALPVRATLRR